MDIRTCSSGFYCPCEKIPASVPILGRGDEKMLHHNSHSHSSRPHKSASQHYVMKKFPNGCRVPVFSEEMCETFDDTQSITSQHSNSMEYKEWIGKFTTCGDEELLKIMDLFRCPICLDYLIQATSPSCGHVFCSSCLTSWTKEKPICPVCSKTISCLVRSHHTDLFIETMLRRCENLHPELAKRLYDATRERIDAIANDKARLNIFDKLRDKLDETSNSIKCKGLWRTVANSKASNVIRGIKSPVKRNFFKSRTFVIVSSMLIGGLVTAAAINFGNSSNFFKYLYLSVKKFNGVIPDYLMDESELTSTTNPINTDATEPPTQEEDFAEGNFFLSNIIRLLGYSYEHEQM